MRAELRKAVPKEGLRPTAITSHTMGKIRARGNRTTESRVRFALVRHGIVGWQLHQDLPGKPDFFFSEQRVAVFTDGCFWHGCRCAQLPKRNSRFWKLKIERNMARDASVTVRLMSDGISVLRFWEHEIRDNLSDCISRIQAKLV
jgi:DNA mismatch endonuclease, patch repair protein